MTNKTPKEKMIDAVEKIIESKAMRSQIEEHKFPSPREFAEEIVEFFYKVAKEDDSANLQEAERVNDSKPSDENSSLL